MKSDDVLVLRRTWSVAAGVLLIVALHLFNLVQEARLESTPEAPYAVGVVWMGAVMGLTCTVVWAAVVRSRVTLTRGEGIEVLNPLRRIRLPWNAFTGTERGESGLEIRAGDGFVAHAWAFSSSMLDMGRTDRARSMIDQAAAHARHTGELGSGSPGRSWSLPWRAALVLIATETAMGWLAHQISG
ncbi:hypothetical protein ACGFR6_08140 [Streptomyces sp. NPDC048567]|uniref:hypothetical protein n=1 Tax=Streptomyces sp. NPDC048567 TaxID=3365570 RepID=UPI00372149BA